MEDRNPVLLRQPVGGKASSVPCPLEREAWSTPVLIGLNAAAGTDVKGPPAGETTGTTQYSLS
jgi:hypothetical protein